MDLLKDILSGAAGVAVFAIVTAVVERLGHLIVPAAPEARAVFDDKDLMKRAGAGDAEARQRMQAAMQSLGVGPKLMVVLAWVLGAAAGAFTASSLDTEHAVTHAWIIGGFNALGVYWVGRMLPHPWWMALLGYVLPLLAALHTASLVSGTCLFC